MFCPQCHHPNSPDADECVKCRHEAGYLRERVHIGRQFIFVQADERRPVALQVDGSVHTYRAAAILSRHRHTLSFGDEPVSQQETQRLVRDVWRDAAVRRKLQQSIYPLPDQPRLPHPSLKLATVVTDRKVYKPGTDVSAFIVAPDAADREAAIEIKLAGQKVYEAKATLNPDGLALHTYADAKEGEYTVVVSLPDQMQTECAFSVAEFSLSPLIASLETHEYTQKRLTFTLKLLTLSVPYSGPVEFGLQCHACGERVVATQKARAKDGVAQGEFDVSSHGGSFHVQVTTPDGNTALVSFPGSGVMEREHIAINPLGQTAEMGLLPWEDAEPVRGFYIGAGEVGLTPLMLESVHAERCHLTAASDLPQAQVVIFNARGGTIRVIEQTGLKRGAAIEFETDAPYTLFTVGASTGDQPFEGWGIVIKPVAFEAALTVPDSAQPGEEVDVHLEVTPPLSTPQAGIPSTPQTGIPMPVAARGAYCWLLAYDARLEHESLVPKLAKRIYESARDATRNLATGPVPDANNMALVPADDILRFAAPSVVAMPAAVPAGAPVAFARAQGMKAFAQAAAAALATAEAPTLVLSPARMEFPELAHSELFYLEGHAARTVKLGDQIGTWRVRAYVFQGADYRELTADIQAYEPLYAELDLPAIAGQGDDITAAVNYSTREPADLIVATPFGETRAHVNGSGAQRFALKGPGRVEVRIENPSGSDWSVRDVAPPGTQKVTASRLLILDKGQTARGERVAVYASIGHVLQDTITALIRYPFG